MGYEKPSTKLTFYKAFFSTQWKFFIRTIIHSLNAKRTSWNEFSLAMASALICLSSGQRFNFSKYIFESLVRNVDSSSKFYMYPRFIQLIIQTNIADLSKHTTRYISPVLTQKVFANMRRVGKGSAQGDDVQEHAAEEVTTNVILPTPTSPSPSSPVIPSTPPHQPPCPPQPQDAEGSSLLFQRVLDTCSALALRVEGLENDKAAQQLEIVKLKARVKKLEKINKVKSSKLRWLKKDVKEQEEALRKQFKQEFERLFNQMEAANNKNTNRLNIVSSPVNVVRPSFTTVDPGRERAQRNKFERNQTNGNVGTKANIDAGQAGKKTVPSPRYVLLPLLTSNSQGPKSLEDEVADDAEKK
nr:hypothetical protein [Tanacetum cinerariifolium]